MPTARDLLTRQSDLIAGIFALREQHETTCLCKRSQAEAWTRPRMPNPYMSAEAQVRRAKRYERRVQKVFRDSRARFNRAYRSRSKRRSGLTSLNPLAAARETRSLRKGQMTQDGWQEIVSIAVQDMDTLMHAALFVNITEELRHVIEEVGTSILRIHASEIAIDTSAIDPDFIPRETLEFFDAYELQLSRSTQTMVDNRLKDIIRNGLAQGHSNQRIRDTITGTYRNLTDSRAFMIARTETIRASAEGSKIAYLHAGIEMVDVLPAIDACPICVDIASGNPYKVNDVRAYAPFHPRCRCSVVPIVAGRSVYDPSLYPPVYETAGGHPTFTEQ